MSRDKGARRRTSASLGNPSADRATSSIRQAYDQHGAVGFYQSHGSSYRNPHEPVIRALLADANAQWRLDLSRALDLCCGSGEVTLALHELGAADLDACDPYTLEAYAARTGRQAERWSFADIAGGALRGRGYSLVVCSFALHLCERSRLPDVARELAMVGRAMLILTPHKRPHLTEAWGWRPAGEVRRDRVRARLYHSALHG